MRSWQNGEPRQDFTIEDAPYTIGQIVELATTVMTLHTGDVIACGTNPKGLGPVQHGETLELLIHGIGRMAVTVDDPLRRTWERGIYMGSDSVNHEAVRRNRPQDAHLLRESS